MPFHEAAMGKTRLQGPGRGNRRLVPVLPGQSSGVTPCFPKDLIPEGRLQKDDMVIFPNIAPYDSIGAVATFGARHYIPMTEFRAGLMASAFGFALDFFRRIESTGHPESVYHIINWNYMPPAGSLSSIPTCRSSPPPPRPT